MKKRLEADLMSIAHRILQLKNKSDVNQLYLETQKLYEKLSVLRFIDEHYGDAKPTIGHAEIEKEVEDFYDKEADLPVETVIEMNETNLPHEAEEVEERTEEVVEETTVADENLDRETKDEPEIISETEMEHSDNQSIVKEEEDVEEEESESIAFEADLKEEPVVEEPTEENEEEQEIEEEVLGVPPVDEELITEQEESAKTDINDDKKDDFTPAFELSESETPKKNEAVQISFEDLLGGNYNDTLFVKVDNVEPLPPETVFEAVEEKAADEAVSTPPAIEKPTVAETPKNLSINDKFSKGIDIDLNDRIAFVKHLFGNSEEDYNRVLNQLITFDNFYETRNFIEEMVKPDYNDWKGKDDYAERFMDIIEKKFL
ncbi:MULTISPECIES: hypothetical protein [unclassified Flavobacterium]|uniref:hypothetical protein n=1 Tax=unclassified Flavobacterium TaxID=196869 RepID=UPI003F8E5D5E